MCCSIKYQKVALKGSLPFEEKGSATKGGMATFILEELLNVVVLNLLPHALTRHALHPISVRSAANTSVTSESKP